MATEVKPKPKGRPRIPTYAKGWAGCPECGREVKVPRCADCQAEMPEKLWRPSDG